MCLKYFFLNSVAISALDTDLVNIMMFCIHQIFKRLLSLLQYYSYSIMLFLTQNLWEN